VWGGVTRFSAVSGIILKVRFLLHYNGTGTTINSPSIKYIIAMKGNKINSGDLATLKPGTSLLVHARRVANGKVQLELAERVETGTGSSNDPLAMFNKSDDRFSARGARRAWITVEPVDATELLGIDLTSGYNDADERGRELKVLNVLSPTATEDAIPLRVQITETVTPDDYQMENVEETAKRAGEDGDFITHKGMYIFSNTKVVFGEPNHTLLEADAPSGTEGGIIANESVDVTTGEILS